MSRFAEGDGWDSEEDEKAFYAELDAAYKKATTDLRGFLGYLDAMPVKRIIESRFMDPKTGDKCSVAAFCEFKGMPKLEMLKTEGQSYLERLEDGGGDRDPETNLPVGSEESGGWEGATVNAGQQAGLPHLVAYNLAWKNDEIWTHVVCGVKEHPGVKGRYEPNEFGGRRLVSDENGTHWMERPWTEKLYRPMTPEERWLKLRNHVAKRIGEPEIAEATR